MLIVEQNVHQVLRVVDRAYLLEAGSSAPPAPPPTAAERDRSAKPISASDERSACPMAIFDIFLLEALINGVLLGGVLALLALGLNLIFGVIDVVWICYAELIMLGMYGDVLPVHIYHLPFLIAAADLHRRRRRSRRAPAPARDPAAARRRSDQPAAGHRRRPVLSADPRRPCSSASSSATSASACPC